MNKQLTSKQLKKIRNPVPLDKRKERARAGAQKKWSRYQVKLKLEEEIMTDM